MQIKYELSPENYFKAIKQASSKVAKPTWKARLTFFVIGMIFTVPFAWFLVEFIEQQAIIVEILGDDYTDEIQDFLENIQKTNRWLLILGAMLLLLARGSSYFSIAYLNSKVFSHYPPYLMGNKVELRENGVYHESKSGQSLSFYETLYDVIQTKDFVVIMKDRGLVGHCIPKTAFIGQAQIEEFLFVIQNKMTRKLEK